MSTDAQYYRNFLARPADHTVDDWFSGIEEEGDARDFYNQCQAAYEAEQSGSAYRLDKALIRPGTCQARRCVEPPAELDVWTPKAYVEGVCGRKVAVGDLCAGCNSTMEKETELGKYKRWNGKVTEDLPDWCHVYGSKWSKKCSRK